MGGCVYSVFALWKFFIWPCMLGDLAEQECLLQGGEEGRDSLPDSVLGPSTEPGGLYTAKADT